MRGLLCGLMKGMELAAMPEKSNVGRGGLGVLEPGDGGVMIAGTKVETFFWTIHLKKATFGVRDFQFVISR